MKRNKKKAVSLVLSLMMVFSAFGGLTGTAYGAEPTVGGEQAGQTESTEAAGTKDSESSTGSAKGTVEAKEEPSAEASKCTDIGDGTKASPYLLENKNQLMDLQTQTNEGTAFSGKYFSLSRDIDMSDMSDFTGIGTSSKPFSGNFDGMGHKVTLDIEAASSFVGFFGYLSSASVSNLTVEGSILGQHEVGAIAGRSYNSSITGCISRATVGSNGTSSGSHGTGGIVGVMAGGRVESCVNGGRMQPGFTSATGVSYVNYGGIVGLVVSTAGNTISNCTNNAILDSIPSTAGVGGIVGKVSVATDIIECLNTGEVKATGTNSGSSGGVGGIAGYVGNTSTSIEQCENRGNITGRSASGGYSHNGGILGYAYDIKTLSQCVNSGDVSAEGGVNGGIIGKHYTSADIIECYNSGDVSNTKETTGTSTYPCAAGGIAGQMADSAAGIKNCYSYGEISCTGTGDNSFTGGIIGKPYGSQVNTEYICSNTYLNGTAPSAVSGLADSDSNMSFEAADKNSITDIIGNAYQSDLAANINNGYPILRWQNPEATYKITFKLSDAETKETVRDAQVEIAGQTAQANGSYELAPGTYSYTVTKAGYEAVAGSVTIAKSSKEIDIKMTSTKHSYTIKVVPANAEIEISNENAPAVGTPEKTIDEEKNEATYIYSLADEKAYGEYRYDADCYSYDHLSGKIKATGTNDSLSLVMTKSKASDFVIKATPKNASVTVINEKYGEANEPVSSADGEWKYSLISGKYNYKVKAKGYKTQEGTVNIPEDKEITANLEEKPVWDGESTDTDWYQWHPFTSNYEISEPEELAGLAKLVNEGKDFSGKTVSLTSDIDLGGDAAADKNHWTSIGNNKNSFKGTFNGNGHAIKNMYIKMTGTASAANGYRGLFGQTESAAIKNIKLKNVDIRAGEDVGYQNVAALVGYMTMTDVSDVTVTGTVKTNDGNRRGSYVGGIAGKSYGGSITDCVNEADVSAGYQVAGIVGNTTSSSGKQTIIKRCVNRGDISGTYPESSQVQAYAIGGIAGSLNNTKDLVDSCVNYGDVHGSAGIVNTGGIVGHTNAGNTIENCYNLGAVSNENAQSFVGGIVCFRNNTALTVRNCYNAGTLTSENSTEKIGGIIGNQTATSLNGEYISSNYYQATDKYTGARTASSQINNADGIIGDFAKSGTNDYSSLISDLNGAYRADVKDGDGYLYSGGYPILKWQAPDSQYGVKFVLQYDDDSNCSSEFPSAITIKDSEGRTVADNSSDTAFELGNGEYSYSLSRKGYKSEEGEASASGSFRVNRDAVEVTEKLTAEKYDYLLTVNEAVDFSLVKVTDNGRVDIANPDYVAGEENRDGLYTFRLTNGSYEYSAKRLGYEREDGEFSIEYGGGSREIELKAKATRNLSFNVSAAEGSFSGTDPVVSVYTKDSDFEGSLMGSYDATSLIGQGIRFPEGDYSYKVKAEGYATAEGDFSISADEDTTVDVTMEVQTGWAGPTDVDTDWYKDNPDADSYSIRTEAQLAGLAELVNKGEEDFSGKTVKLEKDMDLGAFPWTPVGGFSFSKSKAFRGEFDGNGHSISFKNAPLEKNENSFGLFGYIDSAEIHDLTIRGNLKSVVTTESAAAGQMTYAGAVAAYAKSSVIRNCSNQASFTVKYSTAGMSMVEVGGIVGWSVGTSLDRCNNINSINVVSETSGVTAIAYGGGLVGFQQSMMASAKGSVSNCYNTGEISGRASAATNETCYTGGLIGNLGGNANYFSMSNCYSAGSISAEGKSSKAGALVGDGTGGTFANNYFLEQGDLAEATANSAKKTDEYMKSPQFAEDLGEAYAVNSNGGYPIFGWERSVNHIAVTQNPEKLEYNDLQSFDDSGMKITVYMNSDDSDGREISSGWTVLNGKSLKASQDSVTIEYKGAKVDLPIKVNQIVHSVESEELEFSIDAPETGKTPQEAIALNDSQKEKFSASIEWTNGGKAYSEDFKAGKFYRAHVKLKSRYEKDDVYYAFAKGAYPTVAGAYEIRNYKATKNDDEETTVIEFEATYKATSNASDAIEGAVSHLYYEGDTAEGIDYDSMLASKLTVEIGDKSSEETVKELEERTLETDCGVVLKAGENQYAGINLYELLLEKGLPQNVSDDTEIVLIGKEAAEKTRLSLGEIRDQNRSVAPIVAFGNAGTLRPLARAKGPLMMAQAGEDAKTRANLSKIEIKDVKLDKAHKITFNVNIENPEIAVNDMKGNLMSSDSGKANVYTLTEGSEYRYLISKDGYTVATDTFIVGDSDETINIDLTETWDGKTLTEPQKDDEGYYLIGNGAELMWWAKNGKTGDNVRLTADIALNDGAHYSNKWTMPFSTKEDLAYRGHFDGQGHVITGFSINRENTIEFEVDWSGAVLEFSDRIGQLGFFGYTSGARIENLGIEGRIDVFDRPDSMYADWLQIGGIAGFAQGNTKIDNCYTNLAIKAVASTETGTVGGYPLAGWGDKNDTYIGGIVGSLSSSATISNCYSKGTFIGAESRSVSIGGIVGAMRSAQNSVSNCYSTASAYSYVLEETDWDSYLGGIAGNTNQTRDGNSGTVSGCVALNSKLQGNNDKQITGGRVAASASDVKGSNNKANKSMSIEGMSKSSADSFNGAGISPSEGKSKGTYSSWDAKLWKLTEGKYPALAWQTKDAGADMKTSYSGQQTEDTDDEWDGMFGSSTAPPYFIVNYQVKGHDKVEARKFTRKDIMRLAEADNQGTLYFSSVGTGSAGRVVKEYVYLETIFKEAGVSFQSGDKLKMGLDYDYDQLMADRYYYPDWSSGSAENPQQVKPVLAIKSFGQAYGVTKESWNMLAAQSDYLYAYMITFGQRSPSESTYGQFTYQRTDGTIEYEADAKANDTVRDTVLDKLTAARTVLDATAASEDGVDVPAGAFYVSAEEREAFAEKVEAAEEALKSDTATNGSLMDSYEDLTGAMKKFEKARNPGKGLDRSKMASAVETAQAILDKVIIADNGDNLHDKDIWATAAEVDKVQKALDEAKTVLENEEASQPEIDAAYNKLNNKLEDFDLHNGQIENLAREAAEANIASFTERLGLDQYRDEEKQQIAEILKKFKKDLENAETVSDINDIVDETKTALKAVLKADAAGRADAKAELSAYVDISKYDSTTRAAIRAVIDDYSQLIDEADIDEISGLVEEGCRGIDLAIAKGAAIDKLNSYYEAINDYYPEQMNELTAIIEGNIKAINTLKSVEAVNEHLAKAVENVESVPTKQSILDEKKFVASKPTVKLKAGKKQITVSWSEISKADGYRIYRSTKKSSGYKLVKTVDSSTLKYVNTGLKKKKRYYYKVKAYSNMNGKTVYSGYSSAKNVKTK